MTRWPLPFRTAVWTFVSFGSKASSPHVVPDEVDDTFCWATLRTPSGNVYLTLSSCWNDIAKLQPTIDAEVVVTGLAAPTTGLRRSLGHRISVGKQGSIVIVRQPPEDPFSSPDLSDANLAHRQKSRSGRALSRPIIF